MKHRILLLLLLFVGVARGDDFFYISVSGPNKNWADDFAVRITLIGFSELPDGTYTLERPILSGKLSWTQTGGRTFTVSGGKVSGADSWTAATWATSSSAYVASELPTTATLVSVKISKSGYEETFSINRTISILTTTEVNSSGNKQSRIMDVTVHVGPLPKEEVEFSYEFENQGVNQRQVRLVVDGQVKKTFTIEGKTAVSGSESILMDIGSSGSYQWEVLTDEGWQSLGGGSYSLPIDGSPGSINHTTGSFKLDEAPPPLVDEEPPEVKPIEEPVITGTAGPEAPPVTASAPSGVSNPSAAATTRGDFYDAVYAGVKDAMNTSTPGFGGGELADATKAVEDRGHIEDLGETMANLTGTITGAINQFGEKLTEFGDRASQIPTVIGKNYVIDMGEVTIAGATADLKIDLDKPWVATIRACLVACLHLAFYLIIWKTIREYL